MKKIFSLLICLAIPMAVLAGILYFLSGPATAAAPDSILKPEAAPLVLNTSQGATASLTRSDLTEDSEEIFGPDTGPSEEELAARSNAAQILAQRHEMEQAAQVSYPMMKFASRNYQAAGITYIPQRQAEIAPYERYTPSPKVEPVIQADRQVLGITAAAYILTLQPIHRNDNYNGHSTTFIFTNTGVSVGNFMLDFYWPNGDHAGSDGPWILDPGTVQAIDANNLGFLGVFYGYVIITSDQPADAKIYTPDYGVLSGIVYETNGVTPLPNIWTTARFWNTNDWCGGVNSLSDGSYYIGGLGDGDYFLYLEPNYPWARQFYQSKTTWQESDVLTIQNASHLNNLNFTTQPGGKITGTVYAEDGVTLLENINVDLSQGWFGTCTDANGYYEINGVPYGDQIVQAGGDWNWCQGRNSEYMRQYWDHTDRYNQATLVQVIGGQDIIADINFSLSVGSVITGRVTAADNGQPFENVHVAASIYDGDWYWANANTDANGYYTITGLIEGDYRVRVDDWNSLPEGYAQQYYDHKLAHHLADRVYVPANSTIGNINFELVPATGVIKGRVTAADTSSPFANVNVHASSYDDGSFGASANTDANGYYTITRLIEGDYRVQVNDSNSLPPDYSHQFYNHKYAHHLADRVNVPANTTISNINFELLPAQGMISGQVRDGQGDPLENVKVAASAYNDQEDYWVDAYTNAGGYYTITRLIDGDYRVRVDDWNRLPPGYAQQYYNHQDAHHLADHVYISGGGLVSGINFDLEPGGIIEGRVIDQNSGLPLANVHVNADRRDAEGGYGTCTDQDGYYQIHAMAFGEYQVRSGGDWDWCQNAPSLYAREYYLETAFSWEATPVQVNQTDPPVMGINFSLQLGGYIAGHVEDDQGNPVVNLWMHTAPRSPNIDWFWAIQGVNTDSNGDYLLGPLAAGEYGVQACTQCSDLLLVGEYYNDAYSQYELDWITVTVGVATSGIDFVLEEGVWLTGRVTVPEGYSPEGISVDVWNPGPGWYWENRRVSASGYYTVPVPPAYERQWAISVHPWETDLEARWAHGFYLDEGTQWDFDLGVGGSIQGCIVDDLGAPVQNTWVNADSPVLNEGASTGADGCYRIEHLPAASFRVRADGWPDYPYTYYGGHEWDYAWLVELDPGETETGIDMTLSPIGQIEGYVYEEDGVTPIEGIHVVAMNNDGFWSGWTQPDGYFMIDVPAGDLVLYAYDESWQTYLAAYYPGTDEYATATPVTVLPFHTNGSIQVTVTLKRFGFLEGMVTDAASGNPLPGIHVAAYSLEEPNRQAPSSACTDEKGYYRLTNMRPGNNLAVAIGTCGNYEYSQLVSDTVAIASEVTSTLDLQLPFSPMINRPFTIWTRDSNDYSPISSNGINGLSDADQIIPALFAPLAQLDDQGNWYADLLVDIPTFANGGAAILEDHLVVTYTLKPNLLWSDGVPLTSADIRFTWKMMAQPHMFRGGGVIAMQIEEITTPDDQTAVLWFRKDYFSLDYVGAIQYLLPEHALTGVHPLDAGWGSAYGHFPVGNGPYRINDWVPNSHLDLIPNPNYHRRGEGLPKTPQLRFLFTGHPYYQLWFNQIDAAIPIDDWMDLDFTSLDLNLQASSTNIAEFIHLNHNNPILQELPVRQALMHSLDRAGILANYAPLNVPLENYLSNASPLYSDAFPRYAFDLAQAAILLTNAGWVDITGDGVREKNGVPLHLTFAYPQGNTYRQDVMTTFQQDLESIGVDVTLLALDWNEMFEQVRHDKLDGVIFAWLYSRYTGNASAMYHSREIISAYTNYQGYNYEKWSDAANDALIEAMEAATSFADLESLSAQHLDYFAQQVPNLPVRTILRFDAAQPTVLNFRPSGNTPVTWNVYEWYKPANPYDLSVHKALAADSGTPQPGNVLTYSVSVRNVGFFSMTQVTLADNLPDQVQFLRANPAPTHQSGDTLYWDMGTLAPNPLPQVVQVVVSLPSSLAHGTELQNFAEAYAHEPDDRPSNNGFLHQVTVREDIDLALSKSGVGLPAVGEKFTYFLSYGNQGGAPASTVTITDTLPTEVSLVSASPAPDTINGQTLTWILPSLPGDFNDGQIKVKAEINQAGEVINRARLSSADTDSDPSNNQDDHRETVTSVRAPLILRPTDGTTNETPTVSGLAPASSQVKIYDLTAQIIAREEHLPHIPAQRLIATTIATVEGTFSVEVSLTNGTYILAATASKGGLTSAQSNTTTFKVAANLPLDSDTVSITADGVPFSEGVVRAQRRILSNRQLGVTVGLPCATQPTGVKLDVIENGLFHYLQLPTSLSDLGAGTWEVQFRLWLADPRSTYNLWVEWTCGGVTYRELLIYILIDPDGYLYNQAAVDAGATITNSLIVNGVVEIYMRTADDWAVWPANIYNQTNPQVTDGQTEDGVTTEGYYSFLTPSGQYYIEVQATGYQPYFSDIITVITTPVHLDIGMIPVGAESGGTVEPANLSQSAKQVDQALVAYGETLTYTITLNNSGGQDTGQLTLKDALPAEVTFVSMLQSNASYNPATHTIEWIGVIPKTDVFGGQTVKIQYQVKVAKASASAYDLTNNAIVTGPVEDLLGLPSLTAVTTVKGANLIYLPLTDR